MSGRVYKPRGLLNPRLPDWALFPAQSGSCTAARVARLGRGNPAQSGNTVADHGAERCVAQDVAAEVHSGIRARRRQRVR